MRGRKKDAEEKPGRLLSSLAYYRLDAASVEDGWLRARFVPEPEAA